MANLIYVNTGSSANKGDGDNLRTAFTKINGNFQAIQTLLKSENDVQQITGSMLSSGTATGLSISFSTITNSVSLAVEPASTATLGGIKVGHNLVMKEGSLLSAINSWIGEDPPLDPMAGDQWWIPSEGRGYIYYEDTWVEFNPTTDLVLPLGEAPLNSTSTGVVGQAAVDDVGLYICIATDTWKRITWDINF